MTKTAWFSIVLSQTKTTFGAAISRKCVQYVPRFVLSTLLVGASPSSWAGEIEYAIPTDEAREAFGACMSQAGNSGAFLEAGNAQRFVFRTSNDRHLRVDSSSGTLSETILPCPNCAYQEQVRTLDSLHGDEGYLTRCAQSCLRRLFPKP